MVKLSVFLTRRSDISRREFVEHWQNVHRPLVLSLPEAKRYVRRYVQQHIVETVPDGLPLAPFDGIAEIWYDDIPSLMAALSSESYASVLARDEEAFLDRSKTVMTISTEVSEQGSRASD